MLSIVDPTDGWCRVVNLLCCPLLTLQMVGTGLLTYCVFYCWPHRWLIKSCYLLCCTLIVDPKDGWYRAVNLLFCPLLTPQVVGTGLLTYCAAHCWPHRWLVQGWPHSQWTGQTGTCCPLSLGQPGSGTGNPTYVHSQNNHTH